MFAQVVVLAPLLLVGAAVVPEVGVTAGGFAAVPEGGDEPFTASTPS
jgi:hypothetical protein